MNLFSNKHETSKSSGFPLGTSEGRSVSFANKYGDDATRTHNKLSYSHVVEILYHWGCLQSCKDPAPEIVKGKN